MYFPIAEIRIEPFRCNWADRIAVFRPYDRTGIKQKLTCDGCPVLLCRLPTLASWAW